MLKKDFVNLYAKKYKVTPEKSLEVTTLYKKR